METEGNLLQKMKNVFSDNEDKEKIAEEIIEKVLEGYEKGVLTRREMKMITNIFEYMDSDAKDIMTHRKNIVALDGEESLEKALTFMLEENKSRFPVYEQHCGDSSYPGCDAELPGRSGKEKTGARSEGCHPSGRIYPGNKGD